MEAIEAIEQRISVRRFRPDPVERATVERLLECAVRAPNHKLTEPWRFAVLTGAARDRFAELRAGHRRKRFADPGSPEADAGAEKVRREARETPAFVVATCAVDPDELTREEDYGATMMALENLMIAAQALGLGTYLRTGGIMREPALGRLIGLEGSRRIVGIVSLGYPAESDRPRRRTSAAALTTWLDR